MTLISVLNEVTLVLGVMDFLLQVSLLESKVVLHLVSGISEYNDASNLNSEVAPYTHWVIGEESDWSGNHVGTKEGSGVDNEFLRMVVAVPAEDNGSDGLENKLPSGSSVVAGEESPGNWTDVGTNTNTEDDGVGFVCMPAAKGGNTKEADTGNGDTSRDSSSACNSSNCDWDRTDQETEQQWNEELDELSSEESVSNTETKVNKGTNCQDSSADCLYLFGGNTSW